MGSLTVPASGMTLVGSPTSIADDNSSKTATHPVQVMRLDLAPGVLNDFLKSPLSSTKKIHISFGRVVTLHCGNKPYQLLTTSHIPHGELYSSSPGTNDELVMTGRLSHKLAMQQAKEKMAETDAALAMLQSRLDSHKKEKLAKQIHFVPDAQGLPPPVQVRAADIKTRNERHPANRLKHAAPRSTPTSPSITALGAVPKTATPPTSEPLARDKKTLKLQALRTPMMHLLAVRPVSEKFLAQTIGCTQQECLDLLHKIARAHFLDSSKWDLSDKGFKELDIWKFPYPSAEDRQFAVNRAVAAFDRMRLGREDNLWQMLLPHNERGQGKVLSKLRLNTGSVQPGATPRINVQPSGDVKPDPSEAGKESDGKDSLGVNGPDPPARSKANDAGKKPKISEKEALTKRLLSKNPKKATQAVKPKDAQPSAKKGTKKATANPNHTAKSAEFVHDSDDEKGMDDVAAPPAKGDGAPPSNSHGTKPSKPATNGVPSTSVKAKSSAVKDSKIQKATGTSTTAAPAKKPAPKKAAVTGSSTSSGTRKRISEASRNSMAKSLSRQRTSTSPFKPSPLGSSPPTNASDLEHGGLSVHVSSNSSTPLISQARQPKGSTPVPPAGSMPPVSTSAPDGSAGSLKRKANDLNADIHNHAVPHAHGPEGSPKRQKMSTSPPTLTSSTTSSVSDSDSPHAHHDRVRLAQNFKMDYVIYERLYKEVYAWRDAPAEKVKEVLKMHERLIGMKDEIAKGIVH